MQTARPSRPLPLEAPAQAHHMEDNAIFATHQCIGERIMSHAPIPAPSSMTSALRELLKSDNTVEMEGSTTVKGYVEELLSVAKRGVPRLSLLPLLSDHARSYLKDPYSSIVLSDSDLEGLDPSDFPMFTPTLLSATEASS